MIVRRLNASGMLKPKLNHRSRQFAVTAMIRVALDSALSDARCTRMAEPRGQSPVSSQRELGGGSANGETRSKGRHHCRQVPSTLVSDDGNCRACLQPSPRPACAQSVTGNNVSPGSVQTPNWSVGSDLFIGTGGNGTLVIQDGGTVTNDTGLIGNGPSEQGKSLSRAMTVAVTRRPGPTTVTLSSGSPERARSSSKMAGW